MDLIEELTWIEISKRNLFHNVESLAKKAGGIQKLCAVVKGNAYGHGIEVVAPLCAAAGITRFAVYHVDEALRLRKLVGDHALIMLMGFAPKSSIKALVDHCIDCLLLNKNRLEEIHDQIPHEDQLNIHLKIDTGMNRFGVQPEAIHPFLSELKKYPKINLTGVASHFANSWDMDDKSYANGQFQTFKEAMDSLGEELNGQIKYRHISNSAALFVHDYATLSFVRTGICLYGYYPSRNLKEAFDNQVNLKPILSLRSKVVSIKHMEIGEYAGYDITFKAERRTKIALAPVGYSDGFPFAHSDQGAYVLIRGKRVPLIGRVNMNALLLDVTDVPAVAMGDQVTLIGEDGQESISVWEWMNWGTPHLYESLTKLRFGLTKIVV